MTAPAYRQLRTRANRRKAQLQAKAGKLKTKINLSFAPKSGKTKSAKKQAKSLPVKFKK